MTISKKVKNSYLSYEDHYTKAGLWHQRANIQFLIQEAFSCGRIPVVPQVTLSKHHNYGYEQKNDLSKYFDWSKTKLLRREMNIQEPIQIVLGSDLLVSKPKETECRVPANLSMSTSRIQDANMIIKVVDAEMSARSHGLWRRMNADLGPTKIGIANVAFSSEVCQIASEIIRKIDGKDGYAAIHVRRGDKLKKTGDKTSAKFVANYLEKIVGNRMPVYLLTDEHSANYLSDINKCYSVFHYETFEILRALVCKTFLTRILRKLGKDQPDNFMLYAVEMCILAGATIPIYTFKTTQSPYHLCDDEGSV